MPVKVAVAEGPRADFTKCPVINWRIGARALLADRGYNVETILCKADESGCQVVIPLKKS